MKISNALIAVGINPRLLYQAIDEAINLQIDEDIRMQRYNITLNSKAQRRQDILYKLHQRLDEENMITIDKHGNIITGLN